MKKDSYRKDQKQVKIYLRPEMKEKFDSFIIQNEITIQRFLEEYIKSSVKEFEKCQKN